jgi:hypothetical protein
VIGRVLAGGAGVGTILIGGQALAMGHIIPVLIGVVLVACGIGLIALAAGERERGSRAF